MSKYLFYPGCSMTRSARPYLDSLDAIKDDIDIELEEVQDWNCCGATEFASVHQLPSYALIGRNLALAEKQVDGTKTVVASCSACYLNLAKTEYYMRHDPKLNERVNTSLAAGNLHYQPGAVEIRHLLDIVHNDVGLEAIKAKVKKPLTGLRVAPFYGCMIHRPDLDDRFKHEEHPFSLDRILTALGATVIDYTLKTHCCGGHMTQISPPVAYDMIWGILDGAAKYRADVVATLCPMCQLNLDVYQGDMNKHRGTNINIPILYFTQLMGLAFGHEAQTLGIGQEFVSARNAMAKIGVEIPEPEDVAPQKPKRRRKDDPSLPMPEPLLEEEETA